MTEAKTKKNNPILEAAIRGTIGFFLYFVLSETQLLWLKLLGLDYNTMSLSAKVIYLLAYEILTMALFIGLFRKTLIPACKDFFRNFKTYFKTYFKYWYLVLGIMFFSNILILMLKPDAMAGNEVIVRNNFAVAPFYMYFSAVFYAPLIEELTFRQSLRNVFHNDWFFIFISGFIFGGLHVFSSLSSWFDLLYLIPYCTPGFIFAYTLVKSKNICVPIGLHFTHNGIMMTLQLILLLFGTTA